MNVSTYLEGKVYINLYFQSYSYEETSLAAAYIVLLYTYKWNTKQILPSIMLY